MYYPYEKTKEFDCVHCKEKVVLDAFSPEPANCEICKLKFCRKCHKHEMIVVCGACEKTVVRKGTNNYVCECGRRNYYGCRFPKSYCSACFYKLPNHQSMDRTDEPDFIF